VGTNLEEEFSIVIYKLEKKKEKWRRAVQTAPSLYQYLKDTFYKE
jgi:hypothetical protein